MTGLQSCPNRRPYGFLSGTKASSSRSWFPARGARRAPAEGGEERGGFVKGEARALPSASLIANQPGENSWKSTGALPQTHRDFVRGPGHLRRTAHLPSRQDTPAHVCLPAGHRDGVRHSAGRAHTCPPEGHRDDVAGGARRYWAGTVWRAVPPLRYGTLRGARGCGESTRTLVHASRPHTVRVLLTAPPGRTHLPTCACGTVQAERTPALPKDIGTMWRAVPPLRYGTLRGARGYWAGTVCGAAQVSGGPALQVHYAGELTRRAAAGLVLSRSRYM